MTIQAKEFTGEIGIHYPLHVLNRYSLPELIGLAERAWQTLRTFGFSQVWTNDNLEYRSVLASSAAIVARLPIKLGTAVTVPYFRNPIDLAMAFATISELTNGREISLGLGPDQGRYLGIKSSAPSRSPLWPNWPSPCGNCSPVRRSKALRCRF
jgi:hypothetical protein